jgi:ribokinase
MILVFGSLNVDIVVPVGTLPRAGETMLGSDYALLPGGKGANQALAARLAAAEVMMAGVVGADAFAPCAVEPLRRAGVDVSLVRVADRPTGLAAIMVSKSGENMIAVASGANLCARAADLPEAVFGPATVLVVQMEVPPEETAAAIRRARTRGTRVVLNLAPARPLDPALLPEIDLLVANAGEAASLATEPAALARRLRQGLVVTTGAEGAVAWLADGNRLAVPALPIEPIDTTGAGDTFVGVLAAELDQGLPLGTALRRASAAAGLACRGRGAQAAMPNETAIDRAVRDLPVG